MESAKLNPPPKRGSPISSPFPQVFQTPSGLALLELQGTINIPKDSDGEPLSGFNFGRVEFPDYNPDAVGSTWMKCVHLYIGQHQRLTGEVKKLPRAMAIVHRKANQSGEGNSMDVDYEGKAEDLEVVEIIKYKLMFSGRPEPVGTLHAPA